MTPQIESPRSKEAKLHSKAKFSRPEAALYHTKLYLGGAMEFAGPALNRVHLC